MKMWDGRFSQQTEHLMEQFNNSLPIDKALIEEDIAGSIAWSRALMHCGILTPEEQARIEEGLKSVLADHRAGTLLFQPGDEDIHMAVERVLIERIGDTGAKLHTGRSRNDQVATDFRLFVKRALAEIDHEIVAFQRVLLNRARKETDTIMPGYTHLQQAQPVLLSHYWLSLFWALHRDRSRCSHAALSADIMPLGSGALAGAGFPVDRAALAAELGFSAVSDNSMDGVASRDFVLEALGAVAILAVHLSRYAEDLIIWSSREFGFVELSDAWSTGSSMMPQKKNPDSLELIRGKCGRFIGNHMRLAVTLKGVGMTYYKDLQEDKEAFLDSHVQIVQVLRVMTEVVRTLTIRADRIGADLDPLLAATDLADYLVCKGMPFRQAHKIIGRIVAHCIEQDLSLTALTVDQYRAFSPIFEQDVLKVLDWKAAIAHRDIPGGTGRSSVEGQIAKAEKVIESPVS